MLIEIHTFSVKKKHLKTLSAKWRLFCLGLNELISWEDDKHNKCLLQLGRCQSWLSKCQNDQVNTCINEIQNALEYLYVSRYKHLQDEATAKWIYHHTNANIICWLPFGKYKTINHLGSIQWGFLSFLVVVTVILLRCTIWWALSLGLWNNGSAIYLIDQCLKLLDKDQISSPQSLKNIRNFAHSQVVIWAIRYWKPYCPKTISCFPWQSCLWNC